MVCTAARRASSITPSSPLPAFPRARSSKRSSSFATNSQKTCSRTLRGAPNRRQRVASGQSAQGLRAARRGGLRGARLQDGQQANRPAAELRVLAGPTRVRSRRAAWTRNLHRLGIDASIRLVDRSQFINRLRSFDYDVVVGSWPQSESPGNEQREFWGTNAADSPGGRNFAGIKDTVVDALIDLIIAAPDRDA